MVDNSGPDGGTPLAKCIEAVGKLIKDDMESILEKDKRGYLVLVTDGLPDVRVCHCQK